MSLKIWNKNIKIISNRVSELALCIDMDLKPTIDELLDTFLNKDDVDKMVRAPVTNHKNNEVYLI